MTLLFSFADQLICSVQRCFTIFSLFSSFKINFQKSTILGVGFDSETAHQNALDLGYRTISLPSTYFGLLLGGRILVCNSWNHVVELFRTKLSHWKTKHLSMDCRLTLIKSVLNFIPIYALSVTVIPARV